ncbi:MAG: hydroxymethylglutaryl-CoA lyase [Chitinophagaceae bacterium]|nr:MAG: hydroxymethylglutaryl-CoA lyase [Chitinophagaceae bacterium]
MIKIIECPRDAMQGIKQYIPVADKVRYLQSLIEVGFDTLDCGSFVNPKAVPQMADTAKVLDSLDLDKSETEISVIVANVRGSQEAVKFSMVDILGFPFSVSETFQYRNTNASIEEAFLRIEAIQRLCVIHNKKMLIYISMGFGNPYGDPWEPEVVGDWVRKLKELGIKDFSIADTVGLADKESIKYIFSYLTKEFEDLNFSAHFHTSPDNWREKIEAAHQSGCQIFEGAIKGFGGCPMAKDELVGNMPTENIIEYFHEKDIPLNLSRQALEKAISLSLDIFPVQVN